LFNLENIFDFSSMCVCVCVWFRRWADSVKVGVVKNSGGPGAKRGVVIVSAFQTDFFVCGIAAFNDYLVILAFVQVFFLFYFFIVLIFRILLTKQIHSLSFSHPPLRGCNMSANPFHFQ